VKSEKHPYDRRKEIYFCKNAPHLLKTVLLPTLKEMKFSNGSVSYGSLLLQIESYFYLIGHKAILVEDGLDITSKLDWEDILRDVFDNFSGSLEVILEKGIRSAEYDGLSEEEKIDKFKNYFSGKKLAIIYILDGSDFKACKRDEMGKLPISDEEKKWMKIRKKKKQAEINIKDSRFRLPR
jgi:hypothetical protein